MLMEIQASSSSYCSPPRDGSPKVSVCAPPPPPDINTNACHLPIRPPSPIYGFLMVAYRLPYAARSCWNRQNSSCRWPYHHPPHKKKILIAQLKKKLAVHPARNFASCQLPVLSTSELFICYRCSLLALWTIKHLPFYRVEREVLCSPTTVLCKPNTLPF